MNQGPQSLLPESVDALILTVLAIGLVAICWGTSSILSLCLTELLGEGRTRSTEDKHVLTRLSVALLLTRVILASQVLNVGCFLFEKSSWPALAAWLGRLFPDRANALIMLLFYYLVLAIINVTRRDMGDRVVAFFRNRHA